MSKTNNIIIRVSEKEKDHAVEVANLLGKKNISALFRDYINDIWSLVEETNNNNNFSIDDLINELQAELELKRVAKCSPIERFTLINNINVLISIKKNKNL